MGQYSFSCAACCGSNSSSSGPLTQCPSYSTQPASISVSGSITETANGTTYNVDGTLAWDSALGQWLYTPSSTSGNWAGLTYSIAGDGTVGYLICLAGEAGIPDAWWNNAGTSCDGYAPVVFFLFNGTTYQNTSIFTVWLPLYETPQGTVTVCTTSSPGWTGSVTFG